MGLDSFDLKLAEGFRPWHDAGLRLILGAEGLDRFKVKKTEHQKSVIRPYGTRAPGQGDSTGSTLAQPTVQTWNKTRKPARVKASKPVENGQEWPTPWDVYRNSLKTPCETVWTYWDLGFDLGGRPSAERRKLLGRILDFLYAECGWKRGDATFWPMAAITGKDLTADPDKFWKGVELTRASHVMVLGRRAHEVLFPEREFIFVEFEFENRTVVTLPGPGNILQDRGESEEILFQILKNISLVKG